jgi:2-keto-3-deoxy-L-rhamnonate aldolase RhmA
MNCTSSGSTLSQGHHNGITKTIVGSARRLVRSNKHHGLLASSHIDARTMRDIGVNPVGFN